MDNEEAFARYLVARESSGAIRPPLQKEQQNQLWNWDQFLRRFDAPPPPLDLSGLIYKGNRVRDVPAGGATI